VGVGWSGGDEQRLRPPRRASLRVEAWQRVGVGPHAQPILMTTHLIDGLATTDALAAVFADASVLQSMLDVEAALARVQGRLGVIPARGAEVIAAAARADGFDSAAIARESRASGTVVIPLVGALTARVRARDEESAKFVHWGATSQDIADTALVLTLKRARLVLGVDRERLAGALRSLSEAHAQTVMLGRTLLQPAPPTTFGLKAAGWYAAVQRSWRRLSAAFDEADVLQFGGAAGTLASLGPSGDAVSRALAAELGLEEPEAPWHTHRDRLAVVVTSCGVLIAALGKIARDVSLLMQHEVGEAAEPGGSSSTMPQKRNPSGCAISLAAATRAPGLVASFLTGMVQEHERSLGGWHAEWPTIADVVQSTGASLSAMAAAIEGLTLDPARMRANLAHTHGAVLSERAMMLLAPVLGRDRAHRLLAEALAESHASGRSLGEIVRKLPDVMSVLTGEQLDGLDHPEDYLGSAASFRRRLLGTSGEHM
jgi:3-carboxy-cis,cis-muconate cycloisomerase